MTDITGFQDHAVSRSTENERPLAPLFTETYLGFVVKSTAKAPIWLFGTQLISMILAASFAAATLGIWGLPSTAVQIDSLIMRIGLSIFFAASAYFLFSYANRGTTTELQIDLGIGEIREVLRNRRNRTSLRAQYGFDAFVGLSIDRGPSDPNDIALILEHQDPSQNILVATGTEAQIVLLRDRFARDLLRKSGGRVFEAVAPE